MVKTIGNKNEFVVSATSNDENSLHGRTLFGTKSARGVLGIAYYLAKKYQNRTSRYSWDDAFADALLGIVKAMMNFDPKGGVKFGTVAWSYAKQEVLNGFRVKTRIFGVYGDGKQTFEELYNAKKAAFKKYGYDMRMIRQQGIESLESIVPKGTTIYFGGDIHQEMEFDTIPENSNPEMSIVENKETIDYVNRLVASVNLTTIEAVIVAKYSNGETFEGIANSPQVKDHIGTKMGVQKAYRRSLEKLLAVAEKQLL